MWHALIFISYSLKYCNTIQDTYIFNETKQCYLYHVCCHGNRCAKRTTLILKPRFALCNACFIKYIYVLCEFLHTGVKLQETIENFSLQCYKDVNVINVQTSSTVFMMSCLDCIRSYLCNLYLFKFSGNTQRILVFYML